MLGKKSAYHLLTYLNFDNKIEQKNYKVLMRFKEAIHTKQNTAALVAYKIKIKWLF